MNKLTLYSIGALFLSTSFVRADTAATLPGLNIQFLGTQGWEYDSNPLRLIKNNQSISGSNTTAAFILNDNTPTSQLSAHSEIDENLFDNAKFNSTDFHEKASLFTHNQRWRAGLSGAFDYDTTRTSEISNFGINIPNVRHTGWALAPEVDFTPNLIEKLALTGTIAESTYDNAAFINYSFYQFNPSYSRILDPLNTAVVTINSERYKAINGTANTIDTIGPSLGWITIINPRMTAKATGGVERSTQTTANADHSQTNYVFSGALTYKGQQDTATFLTSRNQQPFGNGNSALFTSFRIDETHHINEKLALTGSAAYRYGEYLNKVGVNLNKEISGSTGIAYGVLKKLDITGKYQYTHQTLTSINGAIKEHLFLVGIAYHPDEAAL